MHLGEELTFWEGGQGNKYMYSNLQNLVRLHEERRLRSPKVSQLHSTLNKSCICSVLENTNHN